MARAAEASPSEARHRRAVIAVLTDDEPGVLVRVAGLFSGRGFNIDNLSVAPVGDGLARFTILTSGTPAIIEQIKALLGRLIPVHSVAELTDVTGFWTGELALVKLEGTEEALAQVAGQLERYRARVLAVETGRRVLEVAGTSEEVDDVVAGLQAFGEVEVARTGITGISRLPLLNSCSPHGARPDPEVHGREISGPPIHSG